MSYNKTSYRVRNSLDTLKILEKYKPLAGITRLADITRLDYSGVPVFTAIRPRAKSLSTSQGKGLTIAAAKCSALMEAIEVYFAENISPEFVCSISKLNKNKSTFISPNDINNIVQYTNMDKEMGWITADAIISCQRVLVPFAEFSLNSYLNEVLMYSPCTTGLAGGNTYQEALLHSLLEIIERERNDFLPLEVINIQSDLLLSLANYFDIKILCKKNRFEIPSFEALLQSKIPFDNQVLFRGAGCHFDKNIALNRAITEAIQSRVTVIAGSRDDIMQTKYDASHVEWMINLEKIDYQLFSHNPITDIEESLHFLYQKVIDFGQDILVFKYFEEDICILKSKILLGDFINNA